MTTPLRTALLGSVVCLMALTSSAQDALTVASTSADAGATVSVAVSLRDASGTPLGSDAAVGRRIQGLAFRVTYDPAKVTSVTFARAGALRNLTPLYERTAPASGSIAYIGSFEETSQPIPLPINAAAPGARIGTLQVQLAPSLPLGTVIALTLDPLTTALSNQVGNTFENRYNGKLTLSSGSITVGGASTTTTLVSSANPSTTGQSVTFTASVTGSGGAINGTMTFFDGAAAIGHASVLGGQGSYTTTALSSGAHTITAAFEGGPTHLPSTSNAVSQAVNQVLDPPAGVNAVATATTSVAVSWSPVSGAASYEIWRRSNGGAYALAGSTATTNFIDGGRAPDTTYLYVVRAVSAGGSSPDSAPDPATTILFADDPLVPNATTIKAAHLTEMRTAVNAFRLTAGLPAATFTNPSPTMTVRKVHITELRAAITTARSLLGLATPSFTDPTLAEGITSIKSAHVQEIRSAVK